MNTRIYRKDVFKEALEALIKYNNNISKEKRVKKLKRIFKNTN